MKRWVLIIFFSLLAHITTPALGFDYSAYKPSSLKEIGDILGCSEGTVKSRLFYTTHKLASRLKAFNPYRTEVPKDERTK